MTYQGDLMHVNSNISCSGDSKNENINKSVARPCRKRKNNNQIHTQPRSQSHGVDKSSRNNGHRRHGHSMYTRLCKSTSHIAIIGTGPSALSCALSLQQAGFEHIHLYERDAHFYARKDGYGLTLTYNPSLTSSNAPLAQLGLLEDVARRDCPSRSHYVFHANGEILGYYGNAFCDMNTDTNGDGNEHGPSNRSRNSNRGFGQRGNLRVPRQVLRKVMMDALFERAEVVDVEDQADIKSEEEVQVKVKTKKNVDISIEWGKKLTSYAYSCTSCHAMEKENPKAKAHTKMIRGCEEYDGDDANNNDSNTTHHGNKNSNKPITLNFEDGSTATADFLIGADGLRSTVLRTLLAKDGDGSGNDEAESTERPSSLSPSPKSTTVTTSTSVTSPATTTCTTDLSYLGIMIVLGITSNFFHPLLDERGFYTLDGNHRLFTMPFEGSRIHDLEEHDCNSVVPPMETATDSGNGTETEADTDTHTATKSTMASTSMHEIKHSRRYMWQLSFPLDLQAATLLSKAGPQALLDELLTRTKGWHNPVQDMMKSTPLDTIWGTPLMDRNPTAIWKHVECMHKRATNAKSNIPPVVALGDAIHSMSPFKGQGCNQALMDGPLLRKWLEGSKLSSAMRGFTRDMAQRTIKKVLASREAAKYLHSMQVLKDEEDFAGIPKDRVNVFVKELKRRGITANLGGKLDAEVGKVIQELGYHSQCKNKDSSADYNGDGDSGGIDRKEQNEVYERLALKLAESGDKMALAQIRQLSISNPASIRNARDTETGETCLHLACRKGCYHTVKWLLTEACLPPNLLDAKEQSPLHAAVIGGDLKVTKLLARVISRRKDGCWTKDVAGKSPLDLIASSCHDARIQQGLHDILSIYERVQVAQFC